MSQLQEIEKVVAIRSRKFSDQGIRSILRLAESGMPVSMICHKYGVSPATLKRWRQCAGETEAPKEERGAIEGESPGDLQARMKWWEEARFGLFIHWGLYSVAGGYWNGQDKLAEFKYSEWMMMKSSIPVSDYAELARQFNPTRFDADQWVEIAKAAGMKYIIITAKHHEGFALFRSQASVFNAFEATPFRRDPLKELADACEREDIRLGFYYSQAQDWHHAGGALGNFPGSHEAAWDPCQKGDMDDYLDQVAVPQVRELLSHYGRVSVLWFDTPSDMNEERTARFLPLLKLQPAIIVNNRLSDNFNGRPGGNFTGDYKTTEQFVPTGGFQKPYFETCMTMNGSWGFSRDDHHWKSINQLLRYLIDAASKGGNFLLNVGPDGSGAFPEESVKLLRKMGGWLKRHGEAIYGTSASPFPKSFPWGRCTQRPGTIYLHIFDSPEEGKLRVPLLTKVARAYLLDAPQHSLTFKNTAKGASISLPAIAEGEIRVVALQLEESGEPIRTVK